MYEILEQKKSIKTSSRNEDKRILKKETNKTGIPDSVKERFESQYGGSLDDVRVHYQSSMPAGINAFAYAQGNNIFIGSGQEHYLGHEVAHVVQQKQGRVRPTGYIAGWPLNDDTGLESEAEILGRDVQNQMLDIENVEYNGGMVQNSNDGIIQGAFPNKTISDSIKAKGWQAGHHIMPQDDLKRLAKAALNKRNSGVKKKDWPNLYAFCEEYPESVLINLGYNIVAGPLTYVNNPGNSFDPQTMRTQMNEGDEEYLGLTQTEIAALKIEKRETTIQSDQMKDILDFMTENPDMADWTDEQWEQVYDLFLMAGTDAVTDAVLSPEDEEWVEEMSTGGKATFYRKQEGYFMADALDAATGTDIFAIAKRNRRSADLSYLEEPLRKSYQQDNISVSYTLPMDHILQRHSFQWWNEEIKAKNVFFPVSMDDYDIGEWCELMAEKHINDDLIPQLILNKEIYDDQQGIFNDTFMILNIYGQYDSGTSSGTLEINFDTLCMESGGIQATMKTLKAVLDAKQDEA